MRAFLLLGVITAIACATAEDDLGVGPSDAGPDGKGGTTGGTGGSKGGTGGTAATGATGGFTGGTSGTGGVTGGSGGLGATGGTGGLGGTGASDAGPSTGFGSCVTQADFDAQSSNVMGFCNGFPFLCAFGCAAEATKAGDPVCSPLCVCAAMPPICSDDGGTDADADAALDAGADVEASTADASAE